MNRFLKFILLSTFQLLTSMELGDNQFNIGLLSHPQNRENQIILTSVPMDMYKSYEEFLVSWVPLSEGSMGTLYISSTPGGGILENYDETSISGFSSILTTPELIGYGVGLYYAVIGNSDLQAVSIEFQLIVESQQSNQMISPSGEVMNSTPVFSWDPNPGVPYYHVILSDNPFVLAEDEDGNMTVSGAQAIWQVITSETSIQYGDIDPSGTIINNTPPLVPGITYNWLVMNNYGNNLLYSSQVASTPVEFQYMTEVYLESPQHINPEYAPINNPVEISNEDIITFQWSNVEGAMTYQIFLSELKLEAGSEIQFPVWNQVTTNNLIDFNASSILIDAKYAWKIIASNADGVSSISELSYFNYDISYGRTKIVTRQVLEDGVSYGIGFTSVTIDPIEGSGDAVPVTVNESGEAFKNLPLGVYLITAEKPGFETAQDTLFLYEDPEYNPYALFSNPSAEQIGASCYQIININMEWSPGAIYGQVLDSDGIPIETATVLAINSEEEERLANVSGGGYSISVTPDVWTVYANKLGYQSINSYQYSVAAGQNYASEPLILQENNKNITGIVTNTDGIPLSGVLVSASFNHDTRQEITSSSGNFTFEGVSVGNWSILAEKTGYYSPPIVMIEITETSEENNQLGTISLSPQANIVNGNVNNSVVGLSDVVITATPSSGIPVTSISDEYGNFSINLPEGNYQFTAFKANYSSQNTHTLILTVAETIDAIDFILVPNESFISGKITSNNFGLSGVSVTAGENSDMSDIFGNYILSVNPGTYEINIQKTGYSSSGSQIISVGAGQTITDINFSMNANASTVRGTVYASGSTVFGAVVNCNKIINEDLSVEIPGVSTNSYGEYQLDLLPGDYKIWSEKTNFITASTDSIYLVIQPGQLYNSQNIILTAYEAQINGTVVKDNGEALRNAEVIIQEVGQVDNIISTITNIQGGYNVVVTPEKSYGVTISKNGYSAATHFTDNDIEIGEVIQFFSTVEPLPASIQGLVRDNIGNLLQGVIISINGDSNFYQSETGIYGYFSTSVQDGEYILNAEKPGYISSSNSLIVLPGQDIELNFELQQNFSSYYGTVTNANDNSPIENVSVIATRSSGGGGTAQTDGNGVFELLDLLPGSYTIEYLIDGYQNKFLENEYLPGGLDLDKSIDLVPFSASLLVNVSYNELGIGGVTVTAENQINGDLISTTTDNLGNCEFIGLSSNQVSYVVSASKVNYFSDPISLEMTTDENEYFIVFDLELINSSITGSVVDFDNTTIGLSDVSVYAVSADGFSGQTTTNASGNYEIENLNPGRNYQITVSKDGYTTLETMTVNLDGETVAANELAMTQNNREIYGVVKNQNGEPLENVSVLAQAIGFDINVNTNSNGEYNFTSLAPMLDYYISTQASEQGWQNTQLSVSLETESVIAPDMVIHIDNSKIIGVITDGDNNDLLVGVQLTALNTETSQIYSTTSQPDGSFELSQLSAGLYSITATQENFETVVFELEVGELASLSYSFVMVFNQPLIVSGSVFDTDERIVANAPLTLVNSSQIISTNSDSIGNFQFENVFPNREISITTSLSDDDFDNSSLDIQLGNTNEYNVQIIIDIHNTLIQLYVSDANQNAIEGAEVRLYLNSDESMYLSSTNSNGQVLFAYLYEGNYSCTITKSGYNDTSLDFGYINDDSIITQNIQLLPKEGTIGGLVTTLSEEFSEIFLANTLVELKNISDGMIYTYVTGEDGSFEFEGLTNFEQYNLNITKLGFESYETDFIFNDTEPPSFNISLSVSSNTIVGLVKDGEDITIAEIDVYARSLDGLLSITQTDENGEFVFSGLSGYYDVWSANDDNSLVSPYTPVSLSSEEDYSYVELNLSPASKVTGSIYYNDVGLSGVSVSLENINTGLLVSVFSVNDGSFEVPGLQTGNYNILIYKEGYLLVEELPSIIINNLGLNYTVNNIQMTFTQNSLAGSVVNLETGFGIPYAEVNLYNQDQELLATESTDAGGGFIFSELVDGNYFLNGSHPGYLEMESNLQVLLSGGSSEPILINLEAKSFTIFGTVYDENSNGLEEATVSIFSVDTLLSTINTNLDGSYIFDQLQVGDFKVITTKANYDTSEASIILTNQNNTSERSFYLTPNPGSVSGVMLIDNLSDNEGYSLNIINGVVKLRNTSTNDILENIISNTNSSYQFNDLQSDVYELSINTEIEVLFNNGYHETIVYTNEKVFDLDIAENYEYNFEYIYNANAVNLSGLIQMQEILEEDTLFYAVESGTIKVGTNQTEIQQGAYQFYNLDLGIYEIEITAYFDDELFSITLPNVDLTNSGSEILNYTFDYKLPKLTLRLTEDGEIPIPSATVQIISNREELTLITDETGVCITAPSMHTNTEYIINIIKDNGTNGQFISALPFTVVFENLEDKVINMLLPIQFSSDQLSAISATEDIDLELFIAPNYSKDITCNLTNVFGSQLELPILNDGTFSIPAQGQSGEIQLYFTSQDLENEIIYSNLDNPFTIVVTSEGLISENSSSISPENPIFAYGQEVELSLDVKDDIGTNLDYLDLNVNWILTNSNIGEIYPSLEDPMKATLIAAFGNGDDITGEVRVIVTQTLVESSVTIQLSNHITVKNLMLSSLVLSNHNPIDNDETAFISVSASDSSGISMTVDYDITPLETWQGNIEKIDGGILLTPNPQFVGLIDIEILAKNINEQYISGYGRVEIYEKITPADPSVTLFGGGGFSIQIPNGMLKQETGSAEISLRIDEEIPSLKASSANASLASSIIDIKSNKPESGFNILPGITFSVENENLNSPDFAYWDNNRLEWIEIDEINALNLSRSSNLELSVTEIPGWREYGILSDSDPLGIYDLDIRPNPFTPNNDYGTRAVFRLSSNIGKSVNYSASIFNLNGTKIRTLVENMNVPKENCSFSSPLEDLSQCSLDECCIKWDGRTDKNKLARNGRYILKIKVKDSNGEKELIKPVVLFK